MTEPSRVEAFTAAAGRSPVKAMAGTATLTLVLAQGIPQLVAVWAERDAATEERIDAAYERHIETLEAGLGACESAKQGLVERIRELAEDCR